MLNIQLRKLHPQLETPVYKPNARIDLRVVGVTVMDFDDKKEQWVEVDHFDLADFEDFLYTGGEVLLFHLGFAAELPEGYEAAITMRSSAFKKKSLILTNSVGVIDNPYKGDNDEWLIMCVAMNDGKVALNERIAQFRVVEEMPPVTIEVVEHLGNEDRGGYGTSGDK